jgi:hypothetical protein
MFGAEGPSNDELIMTLTHILGSARDGVASIGREFVGFKKGIL